MRYKAFIPFLSGIRLVGTFEAESYEACLALAQKKSDELQHQQPVYEYAGGRHVFTGEYTRHPGKRICQMLRIIGADVSHSDAIDVITVPLTQKE